MAQIIDTLVTEYRMKNQQYLQGASQVNAATRSTSSSISMAQKAIGSGANGGLSGAATTAAGALSRMGGSLGAVGAGAAAALAPIALLASASAGIFNVALDAGKAAAPFDSMVRSLESVEGGARAAELAMKDLREIAKAPGIGFKESVSAYVGVRNSGLGADLSKSIITEIANANARGGGSIETFERAMYAIKQIASKQYLQGEELLQLMEAGIPVQGLIKNAFGTSDTEELKNQGVTSAMVLEVLNKELAKMPRVAGGAQNSLDNFYSTVDMAAASFGAAASAPIFGSMDALSKEIEAFESAGVLKAIGEQVAAFLDVLPTNTRDAFITATAAVMTFMDAMNVIKGTAVAVFNGIINFINKSGIGTALKALMGINLSPFLEAAGFNAADRFAANKTTIDMMMQLDEKRKAKNKGRDTTAATAAGSEMGAAGGNASGGALTADVKANVDTARNTTKLVAIQQKQLDFQRALIGGGQVAEQAFSGLNVNAAAGGSPTGRKLMRAIDEYINDVAGARMIVSGRTYGYKR